MSTRATIKIVKKGRKPEWLYHHCDGYPDGVGCDLLEFLSHYDNEKWIPNVLSDYINKKDSDYQFTDGQHGDEEYGYLIDCDKHMLKCYEIGWDEYEWKEDKIVCIPGHGNSYNKDFVVHKMVNLRIDITNCNDPDSKPFTRFFEATESEYEYLKSCVDFEKSHNTNTILSVYKIS